METLNKSYPNQNNAAPEASSVLEPTNEHSTAPDPAIMEQMQAPDFKIESKIYDDATPIAPELVGSPVEDRMTAIRAALDEMQTGDEELGRLDMYYALSEDTTRIMFKDNPRDNLLAAIGADDPSGRLSPDEISKLVDTYEQELVDREHVRQNPTLGQPVFPEVNPEDFGKGAEDHSQLIDGAQTEQLYTVNAAVGGSVSGADLAAAFVVEPVAQEQEYGAIRSPFANQASSEPEPVQQEYGAIRSPFAGMAGVEEIAANASLAFETQEAGRAGSDIAGPTVAASAEHIAQQQEATTALC